VQVLALRQAVESLEMVVGKEQVRVLSLIARATIHALVIRPDSELAHLMPVSVAVWTAFAVY